MSKSIEQLFRESGADDSLLDKPVTFREFTRYLQVLLEANQKLTKRLVAVEKKGVEYKGVWEKSFGYGRGDVVTYDGSMWVCVVDQTNNRPLDCGDWKLAVKKGRDGRHSRGISGGE